MKHLFARFAFAIAVFTASACLGSVHVNDIIQLGNGPGSPGGLFYVQNLTDPTCPVPPTFCVQLEEYIAFNKPYLVYDVSLKSQVAGPRPLGVLTAWAYNSLLDGTLSGVNLATLTAAQANAVQVVIWEGMGYNPSEINPYVNYATHAAQVDAWKDDFAASGWTGTGYIRIMNLKGKDGNGNFTIHAQDQLTRVVPEAGSLAIWSLLVACGAVVCHCSRRVELGG